MYVNASSSVWLNIFLFQVAKEHGIPFLETSAKANINVEQAFLELAQAILDKMNKVWEFSHVQSGIIISLDFTLQNNFR